MLTYKEFSIPFPGDDREANKATFLKVVRRQLSLAITLGDLREEVKLRKIIRQLSNS